MSWNRNTTSNSLFIIKDFHGKFHHSISQRLVKFHYLHRLLTIQEIDINNPKHNILQLYIILFIVIEEEYQLSQIENKSRKLNNTNIQWNLWHVISLQLQHGGMSDGGGSIWAFGCLPFFTMNAVAMAQVKWSSIWQCMNHTPVIEKIHNITPNLIVILRKIISLVCRLAVSRCFIFYFLFFIILFNRGHECLVSVFSLNHKFKWSSPTF